MEPVKIFSTRPVNFKLYAGRPVFDRPAQPVFLQKDFVCCLMYLMKNFQKREGGVGEVLKFVTPDGVSKKTHNSFCVFCKNNSILRSFQVKFRFERPVLSSSKRAQNNHKELETHAKLLDVLSNNIMRIRPRKEVEIF